MSNLPLFLNIATVAVWVAVVVVFVYYVVAARRRG